MSLSIYYTEDQPSQPVDDILMSETVTGIRLILDQLLDRNKEFERDYLAGVLTTVVM